MSEEVLTVEQIRAFVRVTLEHLSMATEGAAIVANALAVRATISGYRGYGLASPKHSQVCCPDC